MLGCQRRQAWNGTTTLSRVPVTVTGITNAIAVSAGYEDTCAVLNGGGVQCWGDNSTGELGVGTTTNGSTTITVTSSSSPVTVSGITNAVAISVVGNDASSNGSKPNGHACALRTTVRFSAGATTASATRQRHHNEQFCARHGERVLVRATLR